MQYLQAEAEKGGMVDAHLLNGMLQVHTNSGRIEPALRFYDNEYKKHGLVSESKLLLECYKLMLTQIYSATFIFC